jgi:hypothetical protein
MLHKTCHHAVILLTAFHGHLAGRCRSFAGVPPRESAAAILSPANPEFSARAIPRASKDKYINQIGAGPLHSHPATINPRLLAECKIEREKNWISQNELRQVQVEWRPFLELHDREKEWHNHGRRQREGAATG